ncbi:MAG: lysoplasmalogenase [bacterium]|nr:lysoplasmalogenase [bacterium]
MSATHHTHDVQDATAWPKARGALVVIGILVTLSSIASGLADLRLDLPWLAWKMIGATGFVIAGLGAADFRTRVGWLMMAGLALCWVGDLTLSWRDDLLFRWPLGDPQAFGIVAFLSAHILFTVAFALRGLDPHRCWATGAVAAVVGVGALMALWPHVSGAMRILVTAYIAIISVMVALAFGTWDRPAAWLIPLGAVLFYVSDVFTAYAMFMPERLAYGSLGLPLYFLGVLLLALGAAVPVRGGPTEPRS